MTLIADARRTSRTTAGGLFWLLCFQFFVAEQIARIFVRGHYSMAQNMISDLGAVHPFLAGTGSSPLHALMNGSFVLQGLLIVGGALLLRRAFPMRAVSKAAFAFLVLSGLGVLVVGLAPEDTQPDLHVFAAVVHFICGGLGMLLFGLALLRRTRRRELPATLSIGAGMLALAATATLGLSQSTDWRSVGFPIGAVERLAAYPLPLWLTTVGLLLLAHTPARSEAEV